MLAKPMLDDSYTKPEPKRRLWRWVVLVAVCALAILCFYQSKHTQLEKLPLGSKTPYPLDNHCNDAVPAGMQLIQVQYLLRHGARYSTEGEMADIEYIYRLLDNQVPSSWIKPEMVDRNNAMRLSASGIYDTAALATQVYQKYANLLEMRQQPVPAIRFISSEFQRSIATANTFRSTIDPDNHTMPVSVIPLVNDTILAMKHNCMRWNMAKDDAAVDIQSEISRFDSIYGADIKRHVSKKLNIDLLSLDNIQTLYRMCGYDMSLLHQPLHWCSLFDYKTAELLELRGDLTYSRKYGPDGSQINSHLACALFSEIINDIDTALRSTDSAVSVFRFAHAETIMFASNLLGLDQMLGSYTKPVTGNMTYEQILHRGFRTSTLVPFSSNLGLELYMDQNAQPFFRLLLNGCAIRMPGCSKDVCPLGVLRSKLATDIGCIYNTMCQL
ncbi:hypothetical protein LPJ78_004301 [Coemansia sp. RSA 989]|nr:hypothetical protein LPJ78_004301 [Coemansia sp. RSA 989]